MAISLLLALTLVPALAERLLPAGAALAEPRLVSRLKSAYRPLLDCALRHGASGAARRRPGGRSGAVLAFRLGTDFLPPLDEGALLVQTLLPSDASLAAVDSANRALEERLAEMPGVRALVPAHRARRAHRGPDAALPLGRPGRARGPGRRRRRSRSESRRSFEELPFAAELTTPMGMRIAEGIGGTPADIQVEIFHPDLDAAGQSRETEIRAAARARRRRRVGQRRHRRATAALARGARRRGAAPSRRAAPARARHRDRRGAGDHARAALRRRRSASIAWCAFPTTAGSPPPDSPACRWWSRRAS